MAVLTRVSKRIYILVHGDDPGKVPVHTGMVPKTFEHVASYVDDRQVGISASGWHILEEDKEEEEELPGLDKLR